jgi:hypothetical protein
MTDGPLEEPNAHLTDDERALLESCRYQVAPQRSLSVIQLAASWARHVRKIGTDRTMPPDHPQTWGPYDLAAALHLRDFLADCISRLPAKLGDKVIAVVRPYDEMFQEMTQPDDDHLVQMVSDSSLEGKPWWWHRIPDSGPMLDEFRAWARLG